MLKRYLLLLLTLCALAPQMLAVTNDEMEQARAIAAKYYLRYTNDGSGYLDEVEATSLSQLKSHLKAKEVENLKAFTAVSTPTDYASWSKDQLVEYWSKTFFKSSGLSEKGQGAKRRIAAKIGAMSISTPKPEEPAKKEETPAEEVTEPAQEAQIPDALIEEKAAEVAATDSALTQAQEDLAETVPESNNSSGSTMVYVVILIALVIAVVCLVVYAVNNMKRNEAAGRPGSADKSAELKAKDEELHRLRNEFAELKRKQSEQNEQAAALSRELAQSRREAESLRRTRTIAPSEPAVAARPEPHAEAAAQREAAPRQAPRRMHTIYLAKANANGVFVRADRNVVPGQTMYKLVTSDGVSGSFSVVEDPEVWSMALMMPDEYIVTGCTGRNLFATSGFDRIATETPGTAIFEGGVWKVIRKAKIYYC